MKYTLIRFIYISILSVIIFSCSGRENKRDSIQDIKLSIREYYGEDEVYLYKDNIDFSVPSVVKVTASKRPDLEVATFDVYWVGKTLNSQQVIVMSDKKILGSYKIENFEEGTIDNPLVEKYTGHGMFVMPISEFEKLVHNSRATFQLVAADGRKLGDVFISNKINSSKHGLSNFIR